MTAFVTFFSASAQMGLVANPKNICFAIIIIYFIDFGDYISVVLSREPLLSG